MGVVPIGKDGQARRAVSGQSMLFFLLRAL